MEIKKIEDDKVTYSQELNEINERIKQNTKLKQANDSSIDGIRKQIVKLNFVSSIEMTFASINGIAERT